MATSFPSTNPISTPTNVNRHAPPQQKAQPRTSIRDYYWVNQRKFLVPGHKERGQHTETTSQDGVYTLQLNNSLHTIAGATDIPQETVRSTQTPGARVVAPCACFAAPAGNKEA